jgi:uncharacterized protein with HEPN domain
LDAARQAIEFASASRVEAASRLAIPDLPWPDIIGMRNRLIHAYFDVDLALVCKTIRTDLLPLVLRLVGLLASTTSVRSGHFQPAPFTN